MDSFKLLQLREFGLITCFLGLYFVMSYAITEFEVMNPTFSLDNGKRKLQELSQRSNLPLDEGSCWKSALSNLEIGCKLMTEDNQARMAFHFTSCFNEMIGLSPFICEASTPIKECLRQLDAASTSTFREYFLHTQDMCYYLRQEIWQERTNHAVTRLTDAASDVTMQMVEQKYIQEQIFTSQQESLKVQSNLKKDNEDLYNAVVKVKDVFNDFSVTTKEQQLISTEIFDKLSQMQKLVSWIHGEMSLLDLILFYFAAILFGYFATATARTRAARFWLIILFMLSIWCEKVLYNYLTQSDFGYNISPEDVQSIIWMVRKLAAGAGTLIVVITGATYRDMQTVNNHMLLNMNFTLDKVFQLINDQACTPGLNNDLQNVLTRKADDDDNSDDTYSNYSTDDSKDNLDDELKDLNEENENNENIHPAGYSVIGRSFQRSSHAEALSPMRHRYNLRERSATPRENPVVHQESVTDFARIVKRTRTPKPMNNSSRLNYFSSDDDDQ